MVDSSGPSLPRPCNTVGLQNLGDVGGGWAETGEGLYLFKLEAGVYQRVALPEIPPVPIKWVMDFQVRNPYVYVRSKQRLTKWQNSGTLIAAYIPKKEPVKLRILPNIGYVISSSSKQGARLQLIPEIGRAGPSVVPPKCTIAISLAVGKVSTAVVSPMSGVTVEWDASAEGQAVGIVIRTPGQDGQDKEPPYTSRADVRVTVGDTIDMGHLQLYHPEMVIKRILMIDKLPDLAAVTPYLLN